MRTPLKTQYFQILLALSDRALHGYGIQRAVLDQTDDGLKLWPATLYRSLTRLEEAGLIEAVTSPDDQPEDERRQYYALTSEGRERLSAEVELMTRWVRTAREVRS